MLLLLIFYHHYLLLLLLFVGYIPMKRICYFWFDQVPSVIHLGKFETKEDVRWHVIEICLVQLLAASMECLGVWRAIFLNLKKRWAQKLCRIILLHFGLVTFRIHFKTTRRLRIFMFSDLVGLTMTPQTNYIWFWGHQLCQKVQAIPNHFWKISCWKSQHAWFLNFGKDGGRKIPTISLIFWKYWIWDQQLPEIMKWNFDNMGSIVMGKQEMAFLNPWNYETLKAWSFGMNLG